MPYRIQWPAQSMYIRAGHGKVGNTTFSVFWLDVFSTACYIFQYHLLSCFLSSGYKSNSISIYPLVFRFLWCLYITFSHKDRQWYFYCPLYLKLLCKIWTAKLSGGTYHKAPDPCGTQYWRSRTVSEHNPIAMVILLEKYNFTNDNV